VIDVGFDRRDAGDETPSDLLIRRTLRQRWPRRRLVCCTGPVGIVETASRGITGFSKKGCGLNSVASAAIFMRGHAPMRNIRRRFYRIVESVPQRLVFAWAWTRLAEAV
jgi:hypothetical protein